jgi:uncharacterized membrane protein YhaH (DUF805 family)
MANSYRLMTLKQMVVPNGRLSRTQYLLHITISGVLMVALLIAVMIFYIPLDLTGIPRPLRISAITLAIVPLALFTLFLTIKRAHDLGMPAVVVTPMFISAPFLVARAAFPDAPEALESAVNVTTEIVRTANIGMGFYFLLAPGEKGGNRYGPDPLTDEAHAP